MSDQTPSFRQSIRHLAEEIRDGLSEHPSNETLIEYHLGELEPGDSLEELQDHLAICDECGRFLDELERAADVPVPAEHTTSPAQKAAAWREVRTKLEMDSPAPAPTQAESAASPFGFLRSLHFAYAMAALFLLTTILAGVGHERQPRVDTLPFDLVSQESRQVRDRGTYELVKVPPEATEALLILHLERPDRFEDYRVEIFDGTDRRHWSQENVPASTQGLLSLSLPKDFLPGGRFEIRLTGRQGKDYEEADAYFFELQLE